MNKGSKDNLGRNFEEIMKTLKQVSLRDDEKNALRENLISFMKAETVRNPGEERPSFRSQLLTLISFRNMGIALSIMLLLGGGVTFAAENSLPGELFYPIKGFNEQARVAFALSEETKAEFESKFASRRLEEAEELLAKGELSAEEKADLEARFDAHAERVNKHIAKLREKKNFEVAAEISSELESSLMAHSRVLSRLAERGDASGSDLISANVQLKGDAFADLRRGLQMEITAGANADLEVSVTQKLQSVIHKIGEVRDFVDAKADKVGAEVMVEADLKIKAAEEKVAEARVKIEAKSFKEAFQGLQEAHRLAQEAKLLVAVSANFEARAERDHEEPEPSTRRDPTENGERGRERKPVKVEAGLELDTEVENKGLDLDARLNGRVDVGL